MTKHILDRKASRNEESRYRRFLKIDHDGVMARNTRTLLQRPRKACDEIRMKQFMRISHEELGSV